MKGTDQYAVMAAVSESTDEHRAALQDHERRVMKYPTEKHTEAVTGTSKNEHCSFWGSVLQR